LVSGIGAHKLDVPQRLERSELLQMQGVSGWCWFANKQMTPDALTLLARTTQALPLGGAGYDVPFYKALEIYEAVLSGVFTQATLEEAAMLHQWRHLAEQLKSADDRFLDEVDTSQLWQPLFLQTERLLDARFNTVPALRLWLRSELLRLDADWRFQYQRW
jgi:hypothetical protein